MERTLTSRIKKDLEKKIVFISGPRQVGKTTLTKSLGFSYDYFNYDQASNRVALKNGDWDRSKDLIIFDEYKAKLINDGNILKFIFIEK